MNMRQVTENPVRWFKTRAALSQGELEVHLTARSELSCCLHESSPFRSQYLASNQQFQGKHLLPGSDYPPFTPDTPVTYLFHSFIIQCSHRKSSRHMLSHHCTFLCGSTIFMPMSHSHTHTYSVFTLTSACRQCLSYLMWHPCLTILQTCSLQLIASLFHKHCYLSLFWKPHLKTNWKFRLWENILEAIE